MWIFEDVMHLRSVDSTNEYLKRLVPEGRQRAVLADEQTAGKGRFGKSWHSPPGEGLYASFLFFPAWPAFRAPDLTRVSGLAVLHSIEDLGAGREIHLKEPNDVLIGGRKAAGILTETASQSDRIHWAIVGIGVNLNQRSFPEKLRQNATSLALEDLPVPDRWAYFLKLKLLFESYLERLERGGWDEFEEEYKGRLQRGRPAAF